MSDNLFTMLSAYRPGSKASPFENYCTSALAYFLRSGHHMLNALFAQAAGAGTEPLALVEVQPRLADAGIADLLLTYEGGRRVLIEVQVEPGADESQLPGMESVARQWSQPPSFIMLGLPREDVPPPWVPLTWYQIVEALEGDPDPVATQFRQFILEDILGLGEVPLDEALTTNRLHALTGAALRMRFGPSVRYIASASRPIGGQYRYFGTTFALPGEEMTCWLGLVNETVPLGEHYHLMLATRDRPVLLPVQQPRATGDWKWPHWTGMGRVVRPITRDQVESLLERLSSDRTHEP